MRAFGVSREQRDFADALASVMARYDTVGATDASPALWSDLAELGLLSLCTPQTGGAPLDLATAMETLGAHLCPGPIVVAAAAAELFDGDRLEALAAGKLRVTVTDGTYLPWSDTADLVVHIDQHLSAVLVGMADVVAVPSLSGETWGRGRVVPGESLGDAVRATAMLNLALSAYLLGAARRLVEQGSKHAATREQFGKPIGSFQAVAHPLASAWAETSAALALTRLVALELTDGEADLDRSWHARLAATRAAVDTATTVHQAMGAMGFALETGVAAASLRIRQWSLLPPTPKDTAR